MKKGCDGGKREKNWVKKRKRMIKIVATNIDASRPPERRPTGTLVPIKMLHQMRRAHKMREVSQKMNKAALIHVVQNGVASMPGLIFGIF